LRGNAVKQEREDDNAAAGEQLEAAVKFEPKEGDEDQKAD